VTCVCLASDFGKHWLVSGSKDCIVIVWEVFPERENDPVNATPFSFLYGHDDCVNSVAVHAELDIIVSGSDDGTIIVHSLREGQYLRSILIGSRPPPSVDSKPSSSNNTSFYSSISSSSSNLRGGISLPSTPVMSTGTGTAVSHTPRHVQLQHHLRSKSTKRRVHLLCISPEGYIVTYSNDGHLLCTYSTNGRFIEMTDVRERLYALCMSEDGKVSSCLLQVFTSVF